MALSLDVILVGEILKYRYTAACIPRCLDNKDVFMLARIDTSLRGFLRVHYSEAICIEKSR